MSKELQIRDIMTETVTVASASNTFSQIMDFFHLFNIRHLPVTDNDKVIGIISVQDVLRLIHDKLENQEQFAAEHLDETYKAEQLMTPNPVTISPDASIEEALAILSQGDFHALPVVEDGKIRGIVTHHDLVKLFCKEKNPPKFFTTGAPGFAV